MGCTGTKATTTAINANRTVFQILQEYPKIRKEQRKTLDLKDCKWNTWSVCFQHDVYPSDFLSSSSKKRITQERVAVLIEPLWSGKRNIILFYRNDNDGVAIEHISLPGNIFENPIEITTAEEIDNLDDKVKHILVTRSWFFLMER